jgi:hypothetical protein
MIHDILTEPRRAYARAQTLKTVVTWLAIVLVVALALNWPL